MLRRHMRRLCHPEVLELRARHSFEAAVRVVAHDHGMVVEAASDSDEQHILINMPPVTARAEDGASTVFATAIRTGSDTVFLEEPHRERRSVARGLLEPELRCLAAARTAAADVPGLPPALRWSSVAVGVHRALVAVEGHARGLLEHPAAHLHRLVDAGDPRLVAACVVALACSNGAQRLAFARALGALNRRLGSESPLRSLSAVARKKAGDDRGRARLFCHSVISSVDLAACGFDDPDAVRARLDDYDGLWRLLPIPDVELPTAAWWAQWCDGDMKQCRPMERSMPAHAVLASLLQLSGAADPTVRLFAERVHDLFALRGGRTVDPGDMWSSTVVRELFVDRKQQPSDVEAHELASMCLDHVEYYTAVARSVAVEAVQQAGGRYRHLGIARRPPAKGDGRGFETVKAAFLERGAVAFKRHGGLDMGVAAPEWSIKAPDLAGIVDAGVCGSVPLTIRRREFDVACDTAEAWIRAKTNSGQPPPLCATSAAMGQGKTVQLLLSLGLLVEAYGGAGLYATGNNDQDDEVRLIIEAHSDVQGVSRSSELAMAMAVFHRACVAQVSTDQAYRFDACMLAGNKPNIVNSAATSANTLAKARVGDFLGRKVFLRGNCQLATALRVARALLGCHDKVPLFLAVDEVAKFAFDFRRPSRSANQSGPGNVVGEGPAPEEALKAITSASQHAELCGTVVPLAGALDCFDLEKLATLGSARGVHLMPLSPLIPMVDRRLLRLLPPIAKAICCQRAAFENPSVRAQAALNRVRALLMSTGGHARILALALQRLSAVTEEHVADLKKDAKEAGRPDESAQDQNARAEQVRSVQETALTAIDSACTEGERAVELAALCEEYGCGHLCHPRLSNVDGKVIEEPDQASRVLERLTSWFKLPRLNRDEIRADENAVLRRRMHRAWEFAAAAEKRDAFKVHPPPVALPAVLSRFLVDATSTKGAGPGLLTDRLGSLFDLVLEMNHVVAAFAAGTPPSDDDAPVERSKLFELAVGRVITLLLLLPTGSNGSHRDRWVAYHMQLCRGACTMDPLCGAILPAGQRRYSVQNLRALSTKPIHERLHLGHSGGIEEITGCCRNMSAEGVS